MKKKKKPLACINGVKGAISLFLAVLMTPFMSIALVLVESGRYNSAVSLLDEALGISAVSLLADYDPYLQNRWGLLGIQQEADLDADLMEFLNFNTASMGNSFALSNTDAEGMYPLSDPEVLRFQVLEYSKLNGPTRLASELVSTVASMSEFLENIKKKLTLFQDITKTLTSGIKIVDSAIDLTEKTDKLEESANKLDDLATEYNSDYATFETAVNTLIDEIAAIAAENIALDNLLSDWHRLCAEKEELLELGFMANSREVKDKQAEIDEKDRQIREQSGAIAASRSSISSFITDAKNAQTAYADVIRRIADEMDNFRSLAASVREAMESLDSNILSGVSNLGQLMVDAEKKRTNYDQVSKDLEQSKKDLAEMEEKGLDESDPEYKKKLEEKNKLEAEFSVLEEEKCALETEIAVIKATQASIGEMNDELNNSFEDYDDATLGKQATAFRNLKTLVESLNIDRLCSTSEKITPEEYKFLRVAGYMSADEIHEYIDAQEDELKKGKFSAMMDGLMTLYNSIMNTSIFFENDLDTLIDLDYYEETFGGLPGGTDTTGDVLSLVTSLGAVLSDAAEIQANLLTLKFKKLLDSFKALGEDCIALIEAIGQFIKTILMNLSELMGYERWLLCTYCTYNLTCRTDINRATSEMSLTTMTGYSVGQDSFPEAVNGPEQPLFGELLALVNTIIDCMDGTGSDKTFSGAEIEYILFGSTSEIANQLYVFCVLYILRAIMCAPTITANAEVQTLAAGTTLGYPVVMGLYYFLEPLVQTVLIANGKDQELIPTKVYLTPSGLPSLITELISFCKFTTEQKKDLEEDMVKACGMTKEKFDSDVAAYKKENDFSAPKTFKFSYRDFCLLLMMLTVRQERMMERLCNLIQMETLCYYTNEKSEFTFDLRKSYTYVHVKTDADVIQILPDLIDSELFTAHREQYRGY